MNNLKEPILEVIKDDNYDLEDLKKILSPLENYVDNTVFIDNLKEVIEVILEDRDGNNRFTIKDLELLKDDLMAITSLLSAILLVLNSIPELKLKYDSGVTEELIFKILVYIFLVIVPKETNNSWTFEEKEHIVGITISIYQIIVSSQTTKQLFSKISKWFKSKGWCKCIHSAQNTKELVVEQKMPVIKAELATTIKNNKDKIYIQEQINELKREVDQLKN